MMTTNLFVIVNVKRLQT